MARQKKKPKPAALVDGVYRVAIATNRKARHDYEFLEEFECGIVLTGTEVKSLRQGSASLAEAYARIVKGELWLIGANIPVYNEGNRFNHAPARDRKLLVHKRELERMYKRVREKGLTLVPLSMEFRGSLVKVHIALARGKRLYDKRATQKERESKRDMDRAMRERN